MEERLKTAIFAIKNGVPIEEASHDIGWKDFEGLVAEILETKHFRGLAQFQDEKTNNGN